MLRKTNYSKYLVTNQHDIYKFWLFSKCFLGHSSASYGVHLFFLKYIRTCQAFGLSPRALWFWDIVYIHGVGHHT